jgi:hypothetical protein
MAHASKIRHGALLGLILGALALSAPPSAFAHLWQGCAMCYQNAAGSGPQGREALRHGILALLLPTVSLFLGIFVLLYRRRNVTR